MSACPLLLHSITPIHLPPSHMVQFVAMSPLSDYGLGVVTQPLCAKGFKTWNGNRSKMTTYGHGRGSGEVGERGARAPSKQTRQSPPSSSFYH